MYTKKKTMALNMDASDLLFSCNIDSLSECQIVDQVNELNYLVDNFIMNILDSEVDHHTLESHTNFRKPQQSNVCATFLYNLSFKNAKEIIAEFFIRNMILNVLHTHFFDGDNFFGIGSELHRAYMERMLSELIASGK